MNLGRDAVFRVHDGTRGVRGAAVGAPVEHGPLRGAGAVGSHVPRRGERAAVAGAPPAPVAGGPAPSDLGATQRDEETVRLEAQKDEDVQFRFNISDDDILPTGSGAGAMTALVTHIFLDPSARHLQLRLKYKERAKVDTVLRYANEIREHGRKLMDGEELPLLPDIPDASGKGVDVTTQAP